jgi:hypothetical protein
MTKRAAFMCRDGHVEINFADAPEGEMCPLCRVLYAMAWMDNQDPQMVDAAIERFQINRHVVREGT